MNTNTIRWHLHNYDKIKKDIQDISDMLKEYRLMDGVRSKIITDVPTCRSEASIVETLAENRMDYTKEQEAILDGKLRMIRAINSVYFYLTEPSRTILEMRYFITPMKNDVRRPKYNWVQIATEVMYSENYCKEIDCKTVRKIQEAYIKIPTFYPHFCGLYCDIIKK